jgi:hypothetical protein
MGRRPAAYTRDEYVTIITDFYVFLTKFYISSSALKCPPPGGWPNITPETTRGFGKAPIVIDLIKHLPYIDRKDARKMVTNIEYNCDVIDYSVMKPDDFDDQPMAEYSLRQWVEEMAQERLERGSEDEEECNTDEEECNTDEEECNTDEEEYNTDEEEYNVNEEDETKEDQEKENNFQESLSLEGQTAKKVDKFWTQSHPENIRMFNVFTLAIGYESGGVDLLLDVYSGYVTVDIVRCNMLSPEDIEEYFSNLKGKYERLELVPMRGELFKNVPEIAEGEVLVDPVEKMKTGEMTTDDGWTEDDEKWVKKIYREHGWPGEGYRKEQALAAVERFRRARCDGEF